MRILVISQYFYPENFRINDLVFSLKKRGLDIDVLTGKPNYPEGEYYEGYSWNDPKEEKINNINIFRANLFLRKNGGGIHLFLNYLSFLFYGMFKIFRINKNYDKIFIYAPSPITVGFLGYIAAKKFKCKSYLWVHDLWPESVKIAGGINNRAVLFSINLMTKLIYRLNNVILVQSPYFEKYLKNQGVNLEKIIYYPYYAEDFYKPVKKKSKILKEFPKGFNILFAGNIGVAQSLHTIVKAFELIKSKNINLIFLGEGRDKKRIQELISKKDLGEKFTFLGSYPPEYMSDFFSCADALYISLKKANIFSYTIPGKLQSYLACGKPIIGSLDGIGQKIIMDSSSGLCSNTEDHLKLSKNIIKLSEMSEEERNTMSRNAIKYFRTNFEKEMLLDRLIEILK